METKRIFNHLRHKSYVKFFSNDIPGCMPQASLDLPMQSQQISKLHCPTVFYIEYLNHTIENTANNTGKPFYNVEYLTLNDWSREE